MTTATNLTWVKSSYSGQGGQCIEWAPEYASATDIVPVRDSKNPDGPALMISTSAFAGLVTLARTSEL
ncbi:DUF397 domain-containing protein [Streptomyces qinzhouensis]|uniref:DUF397 domain-containing protein n=1 Tax=Streptomyces qinzhouensis TaxID=2599401 RepID=A0A5B8J8V6_9ACTN|nr:DUF397 domain-containing protein [Streptomyces qinzhouensis]QDY76874.1 DUF397 domain-containing protein [Streptomyces qinzhouensis]